MKLSVAGSENEWKLLCVVRVYHVCKYKWDLSQKIFNHRWMFFRGMPNLSSVRRTPWYRPMRCFYYMVHWQRIHLTFVGSSPSTGICGATWTFLASGHCFQAGAFSGSHHMSLDHLFSLCVDLKAGMSRDQFEPFRPNLVDLVHV